MNKKTILIIGGAILGVLIIGLVLFFIFRGSSNTNTPEEKTTLVYWGLWEPEGVMQSLIDRYEKDHENIDIQYVQKAFTQYDSILYTRLTQTTTQDTPTPDIVRINNTWLSKYQPYLSPIPSSIMTAAQYSSEFYPTAVSDFTGTDGEIYAIPLEIDGLALFYNKKLLKTVNLDEPPKTWDAFTDTAKKLTKRDKSGNITQAGVALGTSKNIMHSADILNLMFLQNGVDIINSTNTKVTLSSTRGISTLDFYTSFSKTHKFWNDDLPNDLQYFYSGKLAMMFAPSWRAFDIISSNSSIEFGIAPVPQVSLDSSINYAMYWGDAVTRASSKQIEAWKFLDWLSEPAQQKEMYSNASKIRAFGEPYSRISIISELESDTYLKGIIEMASTMKAWKMGDQGTVEESLKTAINDVVSSDTTSEDALKDAEVRINTKLSEVIK